MTVVGIVLIALGAFIAAGNIAGTIGAALRRRRGEDGGHSNVPLLSLLLCGLAWLLAGGELWPWVVLPALLDPANWLLLALPFFLLLRSRDGSGTAPERRSPAIRGESAADEHEAWATPRPVGPGEGMTLHEAVAADTLGLLLPERLPEIATRALCEDLESTSLAALAGESPRAASHEELRRTFERALRELGIDRPAPMEAAVTLRDHYAREVAAGRLSPRGGATAIVQGVLDAVRDPLPDGAVVGERLGVARLVGLFYDYDLLHEGLADRPEIDAAVLAECRRILESRGAKDGIR